MSKAASHRGRAVAYRRRGERGFALLEILVAFVVLALGLGVISSSVAVAMRSDERAQSNRLALRLAKSRLEAAGVTAELKPGRRQGRTANGYSWLEAVTAVKMDAKPPDPNDTPKQAAVPSGPMPFWVEITVRAKNGTVARLAALKLGVAP